MTIVDYFRFITELTHSSALASSITFAVDAFLSSNDCVNAHVRSKYLSGLNTPWEYLPTRLLEDALKRDPAPLLHVLFLCPMYE